MKQIITLVLLAASSIAQAAMSFDPNYPIYLSDKSKYTIEQADQAFEQVFNSGKPVLLFVHGRGNEPQKSLEGGTFVEGGAVGKLEAQYNIKVIFYNWNSKASLFDRSKPLANMDSAAERLNQVLIKLSEYKARANKKVQLNLMAHSMGTIVLANTVNKYGWTYNSAVATNLFDHILLSSPDADNTNAEQWVNVLAKNSEVFITKNKKDKVLGQSTDSRDITAIPLGMTSLKEDTLVTEINFDSIELAPSHEIFNKEKLDYNVQSCHVFNYIFNGEYAADFALTQPLTAKRQINLSSQTNTDDSCYTGIKSNKKNDPSNPNYN